MGNGENNSGATSPQDPTPATPNSERSESGSSAGEEIVPLVDELGVQDLRELIFGNRGRLFSAAGREAPVAEFTEEFVILHPPQKPFEEIGSSEDIVIHVDDRGVLLNEIGQPRKISGAKFGGAELWWLGERAPGSIKHYAGWFDESGNVHRLLVNGEPITTEAVYRMRNRTHDGELSIFPDVSTD